MFWVLELAVLLISLATALENSIELKNDNAIEFSTVDIRQESQQSSRTQAAAQKALNPAKSSKHKSTTTSSTTVVKQKIFKTSTTSKRNLSPATSLKKQRTITSTTKAVTSNHQSSTFTSTTKVIRNDSPKNFPFLVSVQINEDNKDKHLCGGAIINEEFVLTAAHCLLKPKTIRTRLLSVVGGFNKIYAKEGGTRFPVKSMVYHPKFKPLFGSDIAIVRVATKFPLDNVTFTSLKYKKQERKPGGLDSVLIGWGNVRIGVPKMLETIHFKTINDSVCLNDHQFHYIRESELCAISEKGVRGPCEGDSGSPLVDPNFKVLFGVLSYGKNPCEPGKPYAFTRISHYNKWIEEKMEDMRTWV